MPKIIENNDFCPLCTASHGEKIEYPGFKLEIRFAS